MKTTRLVKHVDHIEEINLNTAILKRMTKDMLDKGIIYIKGKKGIESFYVSKDSDNDIDIPGNEKKIK